MNPCCGVLPFMLSLTEDEVASSEERVRKARYCSSFWLPRYAPAPPPRPPSHSSSSPTTRSLLLLLAPPSDPSSTPRYPGISFARDPPV